MTYEHVRLRREGGVGWLEFNRPPRNTFHQAMIAEVLDGLDELGNDAAVRVVVIASALEDWFSVGADLELFAGLSTQGMAQWVAQVHEIARALRRSAKPLLAAIGGTAVGGGLEMTFHCDVRFAAADARMGLPEVNVGFIPPVATTLSLPHLLGRHGAMRMLYEGAMLTAEQAQGMGLVDVLVPDGGLRAHVQAYGEALAAKPPNVLAAIRRCITEGSALGFEEALRLEHETAVGLAAHPNFREGVRAFLEKRKPEWE